MSYTHERVTVRIEYVWEGELRWKESRHRRRMKLKDVLTSFEENGAPWTKWHKPEAFTFIHR
jgi:hypothetical protein